MVNMMKLIFRLFVTTLKFMWKLYCFPGYVLLWLIYYFPTEWGNKRNTARGSRQWQNRKFFAPFWTTAIILFLLISVSS